MDWLEYHEEPVTLHSGGKSHWLVRGDLIFADLRLREAVLEYWLNVLKTWSLPFEIVSIPTGGDVWAEALRKRLGNTAESKVPYRVVVDDVVTTGASISDPTAHVRLAVVDRRGPDCSYIHYINSWARISLPCL